MESSDTVKTSDPLNTDDVNQAAYGFKQSSTLAKSRTNSPAVSKKGLARVLNAVIEFPLGDKDPKFKSKFEHELFLLTLECLRAKNVMMNAVLRNQAETLNKLTDAEKTIATSEGETNG